jgi:tRNA (guanosine-2'-O-)-methyltransferase
MRPCSLSSLSVFIVAVCATAALAGAGCVRRARTIVESEPTPPAPAPQSASEVQVQVQAGVSVSGVQCTAGASEQCNGLDDNCDGRIDEGCGYQSGAIQITLAWQTGADIDLYVTDPSGFTISYQDRQSPTGGVLDHDARGACVSGSDTIENVYWNTPAPPRGQYLIELHYWGDCGVAGATPAQVSFSVGGRVVGVYNVTLAPGQRVPVAMLPL